MTLRKLKINGKPVDTVCNQMIFDLDDADLAVPVEEPKRIKPKCVCGSWAIGCGDYMAGHDDDCPVNENKTPVM